ncbi:MAG: flippase-like domain-containing protein [Muribaculaceae bacterium]|nr:flippase-like domain-containing protein [Muribaculaceae bacterium]
MEKKKSSRIGQLMKYIIPLIISIGLCYLLFTGIDFREMMDIIRTQCDFRWIAAGLVLAVFSHVIRAFRWGIQLRALGIKAPVRALIYSIFGTYAVNLVFPRLGEVWRTGYISQRQQTPFTTVFGSMVADRLADTLTVLLLALTAFLISSKAILSYLHQNGESLAAIARLLESPWLWGAVAAVIAAIWIFMARKTDNPRIIKIQTAVRELWEGFAVIVKMPHKGRWLLLTVALWGCYFLQNYLAFYAFPFTAEIVEQHGVQAALVTWVLASISMGVPSNGGIGPWQWATIFGLSIYGLGTTQGSAFANLVLGANTLLIIGLGIFTFIAIALDKKRIKS